MAEYLEIGSLKVEVSLAQFIEKELVSGIELSASEVYDYLEKLAKVFQYRNRELLEQRDVIQQKIDRFHQENPGEPSAETYQAFLTSIGYFDDEPPSYQIATDHIDEEVALKPGPQLVVPVMNARYAINAANARWGSLYDALYGSDVIGGDVSTAGYAPDRGDLVINYGREFLDQCLPLSGVSHKDVDCYQVDKDRFIAVVNGEKVGLIEPDSYVGWQGEQSDPSAILLKHNNLYIQLCFDSNNVAQQDRAGLSDIILESALSVIQDCEDSVAAVDGSDKSKVYRNWLGLMKGDLVEQVNKNGRQTIRTLAPKKKFKTASQELVLKGTSLLFVRNVGHLMTTPAVTIAGEQIYEGILDALITVVAALHDLQKSSIDRNSREGSIYIVKPKMHGAQEVAFTDDLFTEVEELLDLPKNTVKLGIMDEERRTSVNLNACIYQARNRIAFVNTGFLDRTGDDIHTSMHAGAFLPKTEIKGAPWFECYEKRNVAISLAAGFRKTAQIGKGMWPMPDNMTEMMAQKIDHPMAAATCAWVPSPTAATLHAMHYHQVDVLAKQKEMLSNSVPARDQLLTIPLLDRKLSEDEVTRELKNNLQGILGYVVRWVEQGVGCSKVPDISNVGLMEDRATLRISAQHVANWLLHSVCNQSQVESLLKEMALVVDQQNSSDIGYRPMSPDLENSVAFQAARALIFDAVDQPSGYTEPLLHAMRLRYKQSS